MAEQTVYNLSCDCGTVTMQVHGQPWLSVYCHCPSCRALYDVPIVPLSAWPDDQVELPEAGSDLFEYHHPRKEMHRYGCARCGTTMYGRHRPGVPVIPLGRFMAANSGELPSELAPQLHLFYAERVIDVDDTLTKSQAAEALGGLG